MQRRNFTTDAGTRAVQSGSMLIVLLGMTAILTHADGDRMASAAFFALQLANACGALSGKRSVGLVVFLQLAGASARDTLRRSTSFYRNTSSTRGGPIRQVP